MHEHGSTRRRLWRWRRNALRRRDDVAEAWIVLVMWVIVLVGGAVVGLATGHAAREAFARERADRRAVTAVLVAEVPRSTATVTSESYRAPATVRWTASDGTTHTGRALVGTGLRPGATVTVWQDAHGSLTTEPTGRTEAAVEAGCLGLLAAVALSGAAFAAASSARWWLDRRRLDRWGAEWELVGPRWTQRTG
jgi:hypothetical protein